MSWRSWRMKMNRDGAREEKMEGSDYTQLIMLNLFNKKLVYLFVQSIQTNNDETSNHNLNIFANAEIFEAN
jgi:hypothetical protein